MNILRMQVFNNEISLSFIFLIHFHDYQNYRFNIPFVDLCFLTEYDF